MYWLMLYFIIVIPHYLLTAHTVGAIWNYPHNKCAFECINGICNSIGICTCDPGWLGVDCSIVDISVFGLDDNPLLTMTYSYVNGNSSNWNFYDGVNVINPPQPLATGAIRLNADNTMWTKNALMQWDFVLTLTARIVDDANQEGITLFFGTNSGANTGFYGINIATFSGVIFRLAETCGGIVAIRREFVSSSLPGCDGSAKASLSSDDFADMRGCKSPFAAANLQQVIGGLERFDPKKYMGLGSGTNAVNDIYEFRIREVAEYLKDYSFLYRKYLENWNVNTYAQIGINIVDPPGAVQLASGDGGSGGSMWTNQPLPSLSKILIKALIEIGADGLGNKGNGFGIFLVPSGTRDPVGYGINMAAFKGIGFIASPASDAGCVAIAHNSEYFDTTCTSNTGYAGSFVDNIFNLRRRLRIMISVQTTGGSSTVYVKICGLLYDCKTLVDHVNIGWDINSIGPLFLGVGAYSDYQRDSVDVLEVKTYFQDEWGLWTNACKNWGYYDETSSTCVCRSGWTGWDCSTAICSNGCQPKSYCVAPETCVCEEGWRNPPSCNIPKCLHDCPLHAACVAPNICHCIAGWTGWDSIRSARNSLYGIDPISEDSIYEPSDFGNLTNRWNLLQPLSLDTSLGRILPNGAVRLVPSIAENRGGLRTKDAREVDAGSYDWMIIGTVEIGQTGIAGDGFAVALASTDCLDDTTTFTPGTSAYMMKWLQNVFKGAAVVFQPGRDAICAMLGDENFDIVTNNGRICATVDGIATLRRKFDFTIQILNSTTPARIQVDICSTSGCNSSHSFTVNGTLPAVAVHLGITAENGPSTYDSFDVFEIRTYKMKTCATSCATPNFACSADGTCTCQYGWKGSNCLTPDCPNAPAAHYNCTSPFHWSCETGWEGYECSKAICSNHVPKYGVCVAPNTISCIGGFTGANCTGGLHFGTHYYYSDIQTAQSFTGTDLNSKFYVIPGSIPTYTYYEPFVYARIANSDNMFNGALIANTYLIAGSDYALNVTVEASKAFIDGGYFGIFVVKGESTYINNFPPGNSSALNWQLFRGTGVFFFPKTGKVCIVYWDVPSYSMDYPVCQITSNVTVNLAQKVRIGVVITNQVAWVDLCTTSGCQSLFSNTQFTANSGETGTRSQYMFAGVTARTMPNLMESVDVYEFLVSRIAAYCPTDCHNGGNCSELGICQCPLGWDSVDCNTANCTNDCLNDGNCTGPETCTCANGWNGTYCQTAICQNGCFNGNCSSPNVCTCDSGWSGSTCSNPLCDAECQNGGNCSAPNVCNCLANFTGPLCSTPVCSPDCANGGNCTAPGVCHCVSGWTGSACETAICNKVCLNNGNCTAPDVCSCVSGWNGTICQSAICNQTCVNGNCTAPNTCTCISGWTASTCQTAICNQTCSVNGNCTAPNTCYCIAGWTGISCDKPICSLGCGNGNCVGPQLCSCNSGWTDTSCSTPICSPACANHSNCTAPNICTCPPDWTGATCNSAICTQSCINGNCTAPNSCSCVAGWNGPACNSAICNHVCLNGGNCTAPDVCTCAEGWGGSNCSAVNCNPLCSIHGNCTGPNQCSCSDGWIGSTCSTPICLNGCANGNCTSPGTCSCNPGWTGSNCTIPICQTCANNGTCIAPDTCLCPIGWTSLNCTQPICLNVCRNGGTCSSPNTCTCANGYNGTSCEHVICNMHCLNGGECTAPDHCSCTTGYNGSSCETVLCSSPCRNSGTCIGHNICECTSGWSGDNCETIVSALSALNGFTNVSDADFIKNIDKMNDVVKLLPAETKKVGKYLTAQEMKALLSDVTSPTKISALVQEIIDNPFFDPPVEIFSEEQLEAQAEVLSTLNKVTRRMVQNADSLAIDQITGLTTVLARAADKAATLALQGALAVQSAIVKSDRFTVQPKLACTPLIKEKERSSLKEPSTLKKLDILNTNFGDFIDGLIIATFWTPLQIGETKVISGDFYSVTSHKTTIQRLSGLSLRSNLGGVVFPNIAGESYSLTYKHFSLSQPLLTPPTAVFVVLTTYVSNVMNSSSPFNFPTIKVRMFTTTGLELDWASKQMLGITSRPPPSYRMQYAMEKSESQCDPHNIQCDLTRNADVLGALYSVPMPSNAGDFLMSISGQASLPFDAYISFNDKPLPSHFTWKFSVQQTRVAWKGNATFPDIRVNFDDSGLIRVVIPQSAVSLIAGMPVTKVIDPTPPVILNVLIKRRLDAYSAVDDLPDAACRPLNVEGYNFRINRYDTDAAYYRRKRKAADTSEQDLQLDSNSSEEGISFKSQAFGTFTVDLLIVPNTIEFAYVFENFHSLVESNWIVLATMIFAIATFLIMIIPMRIFDNRDLKEWAFLPIKGDAAYEKMQYLISVHCAYRSRNSEPKVEMRIFGDVISTKWRLLDDGLRKNFRPEKPSNFILKTYHPIGAIGQIEIKVTSLDRSKSVELDIDRVIIFDVQSAKKYIFLCRSKLGVTKKSKIVKLTKEDDVRCFDYLLPKQSNVLSNDAHIWLSIFRRPIPSNWTRCERLACITSALFLGMLTNAMFYGKEPASPRLGANIGGLFRVSWFTFWTSLVACFIVLPPISLIAFIFQCTPRRSAENSDWNTVFKIKKRFEKCQRHDDDATNKSQPKNKSKLLLPYWSLFFAWSLVIVCIAVSAFTITLYSLQWGQEKSLQWLSSLIIEMLQDLIFVQTAKVFVLAVLNAGRLSLPDDGLDIGKLTFPEGDAFRRISLFTKLRIIATGLGHHLIYIVTFGLVIGATVNSYAYPQVKALKPHLFVDGYRPPFDTIPDHKLIFDHLLYRIIPNFLNGNQVKYGLNFPNADFYLVPNHDVVIIGPIRVRQIRAAQARCPLQNGIIHQLTDRYMNSLANNTSCFKMNQGFSVFEDLSERRKFNGSWNLPVSSLAQVNVTDFQNAWLYRETDAPTYQGDFNDYGPGGYYVDLPSKLKSALRLVAQLRFTRWLDNNTTAVFIDFNLYNPQTNVFSVIKIVFESLSTGGLMYRVRRYPLKLYQYTGNGAIFTITLQSIWIFVVLTLIAKTIYKMKKEGLKKFRSNKWNLANVANIVLAVIIVALFGARFYVSTLSLDRMHNYPEEFTDLGQLSFWEDLMLAMFGIGFFIAMMTSFQYLEANRYWAIFLGTLSKGKSEILSYFSFFILMTTIFAGFLYLLVGNQMPAFCSYKTAFLSLLQKFSGFPELTRFGFPNTFSMIFSMVYSGAILFFGGQLFISIINTTYGKIASNVEAETDWDAELAKYLGEEWRRVTSKSHFEADNEPDLTSDMPMQKPIDQTALFQKFDDMLVRVSRLVETFGLDSESFYEPRPKLYVKASKSKIKVNQKTEKRSRKNDSQVGERTASAIRKSYMTGQRMDESRADMNVLGGSGTLSTSVSTTTPKSNKRSSYLQRRGASINPTAGQLRPVHWEEK